MARFRGLKRGFPGMDENLKFSAITRSSDLFRSSFSIHSFLLVTYVRIKIYELRQKNGKEWRDLFIRNYIFIPWKKEQLSSRSF